MADKAQKRSTKDMEMKFSGKIEFEGSASEFKAVMADLQKLSDRGLKVGTWPTPERPARGLRIGSVLVPVDPTPPGIVAVPEYLDKALLDRLIEGMPRFKLIDDICGGIRTPHVHLQDEVALLSRAGFKEVVANAARELAGKLAETAEYPEIVGAIGHLVR